MSDKYEIEDFIKKGSFSEIYKIKNKSNSYIYAVKIIHLEKLKKLNLYNTEAIRSSKYY